MTRTELLNAIAARTGDYRAGEIPAPTPQHVDRWVRQFPDASQEPILEEMSHILGKAYFAKSDVMSFLTAVATNTEKLTGANPSEFWRKANFLNIQLGGNSQRRMLSDFSAILQQQFGFTTDDCGSADGPFFYLDDLIFSGNRVRHDLEPWISSDRCPGRCNLHILTIAYHRGGQWFGGQRLAQCMKAAKKQVTITWWRCAEFEDRRRYTNESDVLRPISFPSDQFAQQYIQGLTKKGYPPEPRVPREPPYASPFFSSETGRQLMEREMISAGFRIREQCTMLPEVIRPLGFSGLQTLGFGAVVLTYRNCPNTCPPAFWAGQPWYPLFPRRTN